MFSVKPVNRISPLPEDIASASASPLQPESSFAYKANFAPLKRFPSPSVLVKLRLLPLFTLLRTVIVPIPVPSLSS